jgi:hypothetical protein
MKSFSPHLWLKVERSIPSQIFIVALVGVPKLLRIDLPNLISLDTIEKIICEHHAALRVDARGVKVVDCFGAVLSYYYHYEYGNCLEYDFTGKQIGVLHRLPDHFEQVATLSVDGLLVEAKIE